MVYKNKDTYDGEFFDSKPQGKGKLIFHYGAVYSGEFFDGLQEGYGVYSTDEGRVYEGF